MRIRDGGKWGEGGMRWGGGGGGGEGDYILSPQE